jgi:hypothetical protein
VPVFPELLVEDPPPHAASAKAMAIGAITPPVVACKQSRIVVLASAVDKLLSGSVEVTMRRRSHTRYRPGMLRGRL